MSTELDSAGWRELHDEANAAGESSYIDPSTGYRVFTAHGLLAVGKCCGSGCRHCPFDHANVAPDRRGKLAKNPAWLTSRSASGESVDVLFWSGGKDSYLAYRKLIAESRRPIVLLTTFDVHSRVIAHQEVHADQVARQAQHLEIPILGVPLYSDRPYEEQVGDAISLLPYVSRLVFGDLHLEEIRSWREQVFGPIAQEAGATLYFPIWHEDYSELMQELERSQVPCEVSAVTDAAQGLVAAGELFTRELHQRISGHIDGFGENGEFHTLAKVWAARR